MFLCERIAKSRIKKIINEWDPEGFIRMGAPEDEYTPEINMIYYGLKNSIPDTVFYTFRILLETYSQFDEPLTLENFKLNEETRYDIFECREIERIISQRVWWL